MKRHISSDDVMDTEEFVRLLKVTVISSNPSLDSSYELIAWLLRRKAETHCVGCFQPNRMLESEAL